MKRGSFYQLVALAEPDDRPIQSVVTGAFCFGVGLSLHVCMQIVQGKFRVQLPQRCGSALVGLLRATAISRAPEAFATAAMASKRFHAKGLCTASCTAAFVPAAGRFGRSGNRYAVF